MGKRCWFVRPSPYRKPRGTRAEIRCRDDQARRPSGDSRRDFDGRHCVRRRWHDPAAKSGIARPNPWRRAIAALCRLLVGAPADTVPPARQLAATTRPNS